jgi:hypothetical protein
MVNYSGTGNRKGRQHARLTYPTAPPLDSTDFCALPIPTIGGKASGGATAGVAPGPTVTVSRS